MSMTKLASLGLRNVVFELTVNDSFVDYGNDDGTLDGETLTTARTGQFSTAAVVTLLTERLRWAQVRHVMAFVALTGTYRHWQSLVSAPLWFQTRLSENVKPSGSGAPPPLPPSVASPAVPVIAPTTKVASSNGSPAPLPSLTVPLQRHITLQPIAATAQPGTLAVSYHSPALLVRVCGRSDMLSDGVLGSGACGRCTTTTASGR